VTSGDNFARSCSMAVRCRQGEWTIKMIALLRPPAAVAAPGVCGPSSAISEYLKRRRIREINPPSGLATLV